MEAVQGELLDCRREPGNRHDPYAVAVIRSSVLVGHVPRRISSLCSAFIRRGGTITCQVTDAIRRYSFDLPQGGLEVPCVLRFFGQQAEVNKIVKLSKLALAITTANSDNQPPHLEQELAMV